MNQLPTLNKWREYASDINALYPEVLQDFVETTSSQSRQSIARQISFQQKLIKLAGNNQNLQEFVAEHDERIVELLHQDRFFRIYDC